MQVCCEILREGGEEERAKREIGGRSVSVWSCLLKLRETKKRELRVESCFCPCEIERGKKEREPRMSKGLGEKLELVLKRKRKDPENLKKKNLWGCYLFIWDKTLKT